MILAPFSRIQEHILEGGRIRLLNIDVDVMPIDRDQPNEAATGIKDFMAAMASSRPPSKQIPLNRISYRPPPAPTPSLQTQSYWIPQTPSSSSCTTATTPSSSSFSTASAPLSRLDKGKGRAYWARSSCFSFFLHLHHLTTFNIYSASIRHCSPFHFSTSSCVPCFVLSLLGHVPCSPYSILVYWFHLYRQYLL